MGDKFEPKHKNAKLSIVIPVFKAEKYLRQCIDSVIDQTYRNLEIILIDDGSPDNSGMICDEYARQDDRITVIHKKNGGVGAARNDGMDCATGEWVTFVDPDDWCEKDYYERMFEAMGDAKVDILCSGGCYREYPYGQEKKYNFDSQFQLPEKEKKEILMAETFSLRLNSKNIHNTGGLWDKIYRLAFLREKELKICTEIHPMEDILFNFQAFDKADRIEICNYIGYHYRQDVSHSSTHRFNPRMPGMVLTFLDSIYAYMRSREASTFLQDTILAGTINLFVFAAKGCYFHKENNKPYRTIASEVKKFKNEPHVYKAIRESKNSFLTCKIIALKYLLQLPWVWPLKLAFTIRQKVPMGRAHGVQRSV